MKKMLFVVQIAFFAFLLLISVGKQNCLATIIDPLDGSGVSIQLIDGIGDGNDTVTFNVFDYGTPGSVYYRINSGWDPVLWSGNMAQLSGYGGDTLDFWLDVESDGVGGNDLYSFNSGDATLTYSGGIEASYSEQPLREDPFYRTVQVNWTPGLESFKLELLTSIDVHDGFTPVPIPASALLLGSGLVGLIVIGCRRRTVKE